MRHPLSVFPSSSPSILIIRPSALGDVCRSVPIAVSLRAAFPNGRIAWLVQDSFSDAVDAHPDVDEIVGFHRSNWRRWWDPTVALDAIRWSRTLRNRFDLVVDAQGLGRSGWLAFSTRARRRIGFSDAREFGWLGCNERHRVVAPHAVDRMLGLLSAAGIPRKADLRLYTSEAARVWWSHERVRRGIGRYAVLAPTSRWVSKDWPAERWRTLVPELLTRGFDHVLLLGTASESGQVDAAMPQGQARAISLAGTTTVGQSMAVIAGSDLVIANDSAPLHMAVGFDRPLLALFGPTDPAFVGPYGRDACVLRSDEAKRFSGNYRDRSIGDGLMRGISVANVLAALDAGMHRIGCSMEAR